MHAYVRACVCKTNLSLALNMLLLSDKLVQISNENTQQKADFLAKSRTC